MARYYKVRRVYRRCYPRKRWASNIVSNNRLVTIDANSKIGFAFDVLCTNSSQSSQPTPVLLKFGRIKLKGDVRTDVNNANNFVSAVIYCVYVPQGMTTTSSILTDHPEYIIGWTTISLDSGNTFSCSSSLKRNLNSGDKILLLFQVDSVNSTTSARNFNFYYTAQYWTTSA